MSANEILTRVVYQGYLVFGFSVIFFTFPYKPSVRWVERAKPDME